MKTLILKHYKFLLRSVRFFTVECKWRCGCVGAGESPGMVRSKCYNVVMCINLELTKCFSYLILIINYLCDYLLATQSYGILC